MDLDQARSFATSNHHAVLATRTRDEGIQQSPVLVGVDDEGRFMVSSRETAFKTRNLRRDPWVQFCLVPDGFFGDWIYVEGQATVLSLPDAMEPLMDYYRRLSGEHDDWPAYRDSMEQERRVMIHIDAVRAGPDREG